MISIILAAGQGTRMRPLSYIFPKILLPVRGKPVLEYLLLNLKNLNISHNYIVVSEHYDTLQNYLQKTDAKKVTALKVLGWETGGDLSIALNELDNNEDVIVMNGDIITDVDLMELYKFHIEKEAPVSMALFELTDKEEAKRFGQIDLRTDNSISEFLEKNTKIERKTDLVNMGFYIFSNEFIKEHSHLLTPRRFKLESEFFPLIAKEHLLYGKPLKLNYWWDVGTMSSYLKAEHFFITENGIIPP